MLTHTQKIIKIDKIKPYEKNARLHSSEQIKQIMESVKEFGFTNPLIVDSDGNLIAGHGRLEAVKQLNKVEFVDSPILELPCVEVNGLSENQKRALVIADNRIAENSTWDFELLKMEIDELANENFDLNLLGFNLDELNELMSEISSDVEENGNLSNYGETSDHLGAMRKKYLAPPPSLFWTRRIKNGKILKKNGERR